MPFSSRSALALRLGLAVLAMSLLAGAYSRIHSVPTMSAAAKDFLNSLWPEQREKALFKMEEDERFNWFLCAGPSPPGPGAGAGRRSGPRIHPGA
jgi:hypothetical protein